MKLGTLKKDISELEDRLKGNAEYMFLNQQKNKKVPKENDCQSNCKQLKYDLRK